jgi:hypothetical protein
MDEESTFVRLSVPTWGRAGLQRPSFRVTKKAPERHLHSAGEGGQPFKKPDALVASPVGNAINKHLESLLA